MNSAQIRTFNYSIIKKKEVMNMDISSIGKIKVDAIKKDILSMYEYLHLKKLYNNNGKLIENNFYDKVFKNINFDNFKNDKSFAFILKFTDQRLLPTNEKLFDTPYRKYFDRNQNNGLDIGEPVVIVHKSLDSKWFYALSKYSGGWINKKNLVKADFTDIAVIDKVKFIVIISGKADLYTNRSLTAYFTTTRMGNRYIFSHEYDNCYEILVPQSKNDFMIYKRVYLNKGDAHIGYLPYTQKNVIQQAFKMLNMPYGWGDMGQEQDCSKFIQEVFFTFGIYLPRNSTGQAKIGNNIYLKNKKGILRDVVNNYLKHGITILQMPGHVMLYLGYYDNQHYVIHDFFGTRVNENRKLYDLIVNKVEVTPLSLGEHTKSGSLLDRVRSISIIEEVH
jgi:hypothetical protein